MILRTKIYALFLLFLHAVTGAAQLPQQTYTDAYDLDFSMAYDASILYPWLENAAYANHATSIFIEEKDQTIFAKAYEKGSPVADRLKTEFEQRIILPNNKQKEAVVKLESKGYHIKKVKMTLQAIDTHERVLKTQTLTFNTNTTTSSTTQSIDIQNAEMLNIQIYAEGEPNEEAFIALTRLQIELDGKPIDTFAIRQLAPITAHKFTGVVPFYAHNNRNLPIIKQLKNKKIIGLGESIHGNKAIQNLTDQLIFQAIEKQNCRLILLEMPFERALAYNRYIQDENYQLDSTYIQSHPSIEFLNKLRNINRKKSSENKVKLYGMDYNYMRSTRQNTAMDIFDFITTINKDFQNEALNRLMIHLTEKDPNKAIRLIETQTAQLSQHLTSEELKSIAHILQLSAQVGEASETRFMLRDSVMFANAKFLIDTFNNDKNTQTIIYGHAVHVNSASTFPAVPATSLGTYLQKAYTNNYWPIVLLVGKGTTTAYDEEFNRVEKPLSNAPTNSIEHTLSHLQADISYLPLTSVFDHITLSRFKGSHHIHQEFYPFNLQQRFRGAFFIKNATNGDEKQAEVNHENPAEAFRKKLQQRHITLQKIQMNLKK